MMNYGELLLSKIVEVNDVGALTRYRLNERDFLTNEEKQAYNFIMEYAKTNRNNAPDFRTLIANVNGFNFRENVSDSLEYMAKQLKDYSSKVNIMEIMNNQASKNFGEMNSVEYIDWLSSELENIKQQGNSQNKIGMNLALDTNKYLEEYQARKRGESFKIWKSAFPTLNDNISGYLSGNVYTWYGRSGRGKSVFTMIEAVESAMQGATVLVWALEMNTFDWLTRAYTYISAKQGLKQHYLNGTSYTAGFNSIQLMNGNLNEVDEVGFMDFLRNINSIIPGQLIIRGVDDEGLYHKGVKELEADILQTKADVVVVDPIYYMDYERNYSNTAGGDVANTSKKLRHLAGRCKCVMHLITQAEEVRTDKDESGNRQLKAPTRAEIKKTKAVLEDAVNTFGIDTCDGRFIIEVGKGRNGGEGTTVEGIFLPSVGFVKEYDKQELVEEFEDFGF